MKLRETWRCLLILLAVAAAPANALGAAPALDATMTTVTPRDMSETLFMQRLAGTVPRAALIPAPPVSPDLPGDLPGHARAAERRAEAETQRARALQREADTAARDAGQAGRQTHQARHQVEQQAHAIRQAAGLP